MKTKYIIYKLDDVQYCICNDDVHSISTVTDVIDYSKVDVKNSIAIAKYNKYDYIIDIINCVFIIIGKNYKYNFINIF